MSDLISRERALADLEGHEYSTDCDCETDAAWARGYNAGIAHARNHLVHQPGIEPPARGEWIAQNKALTRFKCSNCKAGNYDGSEDFCPNCDAYMRKKVE